MIRIAPSSIPETSRAAPVAPPPAAGPPSPAINGAEAEAVAAAAVRPNPALRLDAELGLVVLEFRDNGGEVAASIPTSREFDAYRQAARTGAPRPGTSTAAALR